MDSQSNSGLTRTDVSVTDIYLVQSDSKKKKDLVRLNSKQMSEAGLVMHSVAILNFGGFPAVNAEVCLCLRHISRSIIIIAKGSNSFEENISPTSPSLTLSWLERFRHI